MAKKAQKDKQWYKNSGWTQMLPGRVSRSCPTSALLIKKEIMFALFIFVLYVCINV